MEQEYQQHINQPYFKVHKVPTYEEWLKIRNRQQPQFIQDQRSEYQKLQAKERKNQEQMSENLYKNQHLWNWTSPFTNIKVTKDNSEQVFNFNRAATNSTIFAASLPTMIANPITTVSSVIGGSKVGETVADKPGEIIGNLSGSVIGGIPGVKLDYIDKNMLSLQQIKSNYANQGRYTLNNLKPASYPSIKRSIYSLKKQLKAVIDSKLEPLYKMPPTFERGKRPLWYKRRYER